ncbi:MAG: hypothetical protein LUB59_05285 [Candidatus Gastranaerophilales bacterium]|nr:hypothetical protein [Candidatus Gastranaerophilales bacterium]
MFRFFKNVFNAIVIVLACVGITTLWQQHAFDKITENITDMFSTDKTKIEAEVGDFSSVNPEYNIGSAVKVMGYKTVVAQHSNSGQRMIIVDSGKKSLLSEEDIKGDGVKLKLEELSKKFKHNSTSIENMVITEKGYMNAYGQRVPYVKFNAKVSNFPKSNISGIVSVVDSDAENQKLIVSINDKDHYSEIIATEFFKNIKDAKNNP